MTQHLPPSCPPDGTNTAFLVHGRGSVRATLHRGHREQADNHEGMGRDLRVHGDVAGPRGASGVILNRSIPAGSEKIHGAAWSPQAIPVGSGNAAGRGLQASKDLGLGESTPTSGERGGRVATPAGDGVEWPKSQSR